VSEYPETEVMQEEEVETPMPAAESDAEEPAEGADEWDD
jgi:hypothetical protein